MRTTGAYLQSTLSTALRGLIATSLLCVAFGTTCAQAQAEGPDMLVKRVSSDVLDSIQADPSIQAGNVGSVVTLVNTKILPYFDFARMTAAAVGPAWNKATPAQRESLEGEFKTLLIRVYSGALSDARGRTIVLKPMRDAVTNPEVVVRTEVRGQGDPVELDFRVANEGSQWKIYDMNVGGVWLVDNYRGSFAQEIDNAGIDGLIARLSSKNKSSAH